MEEALGSCQEEVASHVARLGELERAHHSEVDTLRNQVSNSQNFSGYLQKDKSLRNKFVSKCMPLKS